MSDNMRKLERLMQELQLAGAERSRRAHQYVNDDSHFLSLAVLYLRSGVTGSDENNVQVNDEVILEFRKMMSDHHTSYMTQMAAILASLEQLTQKVRSRLDKQQQEDDGT